MQAVVTVGGILKSVGVVDDSRSSRCFLGIRVVLLFWLVFQFEPTSLIPSTQLEHIPQGSITSTSRIQSAGPLVYFPLLHRLCALWLTTDRQHDASTIQEQGRGCKKEEEQGLHGEEEPHLKERNPH